MNGLGRHYAEIKHYDRHKRTSIVLHPHVFPRIVKFVETREHNGAWRRGEWTGIAYWVWNFS
jgi:hypothetical protein